MSLKSFLCTMAIFCGGYVSNTLLDEAVDAAEKYFRVQTSTYKTDSSGFRRLPHHRLALSNLSNGCRFPYRNFENAHLSTKFGNTTVFFVGSV
jgi:hypothetical protein